MKPDEVLALVTDLKESLEELYKKMADKSAQRQKLSMIGMSGKGSDAGEDMRSADASKVGKYPSRLLPRRSITT